ncbi:MAG: pyridoxamine 5'-phosphate oxidase family protein [Candidatus Dormibacteraeota bacterium]|nr:pyridoxamine 5'-phosphate oxidase family protein [Candidatus Dormibacteraeota bacterium]
MPESELDEIPEAECLELLARTNLGRIAFLAEDQLEIFPVNYGLRKGIVVIRTAPGTKLSYAPESQVVFEIDEYDSERGLGWSVVLHGVAYDVTDAGDDFSWAARGAKVTPVAPGTKVHRLAIKPSATSGRRFRRLASEQFLG